MGEGFVPPALRAEAGLVFVAVTLRAFGAAVLAIRGKPAEVRGRHVLETARTEPRPVPARVTFKRGVGLALRADARVAADMVGPRFQHLAVP